LTPASLTLIMQSGRRRDPQHRRHQRATNDVLLTVVCSQVDGRRMQRPDAIVRAGRIYLRDALLTDRDMDVLPSGMDARHM
jgi:hypothetical protein